MPIQIGSPYNIPPLGEEEFPTPEQAIAASNAHGWGGRIGPTVHGGWKPIPPPAPAETLPPPPGTPPTAGTPPAKAPADGSTAPAPGPVIRGTVRPGTPSVPVPQGPTASAAPPMILASATTPNMPDRTNNPGNIKDGPFARAQPGYVGAGPSAKDGGNFAIFDTPSSGLNAMSNLLAGPHYANLTVDGAANRWSNGGYGGEVGARVGIKPERLISSLNNDERTALAGSIAQREGFTGGVPPAPPPPPRPQVPPRPAPPPAAPVSSPSIFTPSAAYAAEVPPGATMQPPATGFDRDAVVPHVVMPSGDTGDGGGAVGYPSAAPAVPAGPRLITVQPPAPERPAAGTPAPAATGAPQMPAPAPVLPGIPTEPKSGQPLESETHQYTGGVTQTYHAPPRGSTDEQGLMRWAGITDMSQATPQQLEIYNGEKRFLAWQERMDSANIARISQAPSETEKRETDRLHFINSAVADLESDPRFDTPEKRAHYVGWVTYPQRVIEQNLGSEDATTIADFRRKIAFLAPSTFEADARNETLSGPDLQYLAPLSLNPYNATQFEANLQGLRDISARQIAFHAYISGLARDNPAALDDPRTLQYFNDQYRQAQQQQSAAPAPPAPPAPPARAAPQAATPPPTASSPWAPTSTWTVQ